jgi:Ca2+-binding RTX toxin-like protein
VTFVEAGGPATLSGAVTAVGAAGGVIDYTGASGGLTYYATGGAETVNAGASSTNNVMWAGGGLGDNDLLIGGSGNNALIAGAGADTLSGGSGPTLFEFLAGRSGGTDVITDFTPADTVDLVGYGAGAAAAAEQTAVVSGGNTTITLSDNTRITFLGVTSAGAFTGHVVSS